MVVVAILIFFSIIYILVKPFKVTIESGNAEDRFEIAQNSTQAHTDSALKPEPTVYQNFTLNGEVIIVCPNNTNSSSQTIEKTVQTAQTFSGITTDVALMIIKQPLDFEATSQYLLYLTVEDDGGRQGQITIQVKELVWSCPFSCKPSGGERNILYSLMTFLINFCTPPAKTLCWQMSGQSAVCYHVNVTSKDVSLSL